jgi:predicted protein tyrosine phosphatase
MKIKVFNEEEIQHFITEEKHIVVSIQDPNYGFVILPANSNRIDWVGLNFYDLDEDTEVFPYSKFIFTSIQARIILDFVDLWKNKIDLICINCCAGISRSAGVAAALSKILNGDDSYYFKHYLPNMLVYRKILKEYYGDNFNNFTEKKEAKDNPDIKFI